MTRGFGEANRDARAQTTLDFAIGASVFLLAVAFVFGFVPTMFDPYTADDGDGMIFADRTARYLTEGALAESPAEPHELDPACTAAFFAAEDDYEPADGCAFAPESSLDDTLAAGGRSVNVTLHDLDASPAAPATLERGGDAVDLRRGATGVPESVVVARRVVHLRGQPYRLTVRVW